MRVWRLCAAAVVAVMGCTPVIDPQLPPGSRSLESSSEVLLREHYSAAAEPQRVVIRDSQGWSRFWAETHASRSPVADAPAVDFATNIVIVAGMGTKPSGGYSIEIADVYERDGIVYAVVYERSPGRMCVTTAALTSPLTAVRVPRPGAQVSFIEREEVTDC